MSQILFSLLLAAGALAFDAGSGSGDAPPAPPAKHHRPPREAIAACANLKADDACSFKIRDHDIAGTCKARRADPNELACRPDHPRPHHDHHDTSRSAAPPPTSP